MTYRVVQWSTGNVGRRALRTIIARPDLELVGVWVSGPAKAGRDAGALAGLDREIGVAATTDAQALLELRPDCVVYTAMADDRLGEAVEDLKLFLRAGINVVSSSPVFLQYPYGTLPSETIEEIEAAAAAGGASLWVNGIDPGWANDWLPLLLTSGSERIDAIVCSEILDYSTYDNAKVLFDIMGFGSALDDLPLLLQPGVLTLAWGSVIHQLAAALDLRLDSVTQHFERLPTPEPLRVGDRTIAPGTAAALRFQVVGLRDDHPALTLEHITRLHPALAPDWPQPAGKGCYRVEVTGDPHYLLDLRLDSDGDHALGGVVGTAARLVNAVPAVIEARPGLLTATDLPLTPARGLVSGQDSA
ncbi:diacylglycerol kinase [Nocardia terpenica]|uniref:NAD(P)H-dependent amine dehydrogenase family protein n=1 Tax=Nocardia terpenica TaxID=455432 RepID=UPI00189465AF|nr:diacylglycerol kinase [Nocardia terpenica]MBF6062480.1 diacylglycerol kinase [Nocardia terpenica]MBF6104568.1 diacylglycerol kinase [Nocardia terpenica]MBF6109577.1 diacylglycerol kinase [Nocardia terpenica]MBF6119882.1 diacylglycerol kinase [Nocardia terpenica]MBF6152293.1 diacylglycerol kinase [Nocardia terpenica]